MNTPTTDSAAVELFTIPEAAEALRVPEGWLRKKVTAGSVPHSRLGKHVRFTTEHLRQIVVAGAVEPATGAVVVAHGLSPRARRVNPAV
jgi:excisionase family DNA binding protein